MDLAAMRRTYTQQGLRRKDLQSNPIDQFKNWFEEAQQASSFDWLEPNAMTLATASSSGEVSARIVLLKGVEETGFIFYTNYHSTKGEQLSENPNAALLFFWPHLERQIRIEGKVAPLSAQQSEAYFHSRPRGSQLGAIASDQSQVIANRSLLEQRLVSLREKFKDKTIPKPEHWGGYQLDAHQFEYWQGRDNRLHDRFLYQKMNNEWIIQRLAP